MKLDSQMVGNAGLYFTCYRLSLLGWNAMPTARNARGIDIVAYSRDGNRYLGIQVKSLSKRAPVPLGTSLENVMGDFWVIINRIITEPTACILTPDEVKRLAHRGEKDGRVSFWLQPNVYDSPWSPPTLATTTTPHPVPDLFSLGQVDRVPCVL